MSLLSEMRAHELLRLQASALAEALAETGETLTKAPRSAAGDASRLRGLPMIGGVGGHIPGTRPGTGAHVDRIDQRRTPR
jgi:hypothetical protein